MRVHLNPIAPHPWPGSRCTPFAHTQAPHTRTHVHHRAVTSQLPLLWRFGVCTCAQHGKGPAPTKNSIEPEAPQAWEGHAATRAPRSARRFPGRRRVLVQGEGAILLGAVDTACCQGVPLGPFGSECPGPTLQGPSVYRAATQLPLRCLDTQTSARRRQEFDPNLFFWTCEAVQPAHHTPTRACWYGPGRGDCVVPSLPLAPPRRRYCWIHRTPIRLTRGSNTWDRYTPGRTCFPSNR
jgi:hypothetical protein